MYAILYANRRGLFPLVCICIQMQGPAVARVGLLVEWWVYLYLPFLFYEHASNTSSSFSTCGKLFLGLVCVRLVCTQDFQRLYDKQKTQIEVGTWVTHMYVQEVARLAEGFSGADLELLCREAAMHGSARCEHHCMFVTMCINVWIVANIRTCFVYLPLAFCSTFWKFVLCGNCLCKKPIYQHEVYWKPFSTLQEAHICMTPLITRSCVLRSDAYHRCAGAHGNSGRYDALSRTHKRAACDSVRLHGCSHDHHLYTNGVMC